MHLARLRQALAICAVAMLASCAPVRSLEQSPSPAPAGTSEPAARVGPDLRPIDVRTALDVAAFVTPSGQIVCLLSSDGVRCDYFAEDKAWQAPQPGNCDIDTGWSLSVDRTAGTSCVGDSIVAKAAKGSGFESWHRPGDPAVAWNGLTLAALPYGATIVVTTFRCDNLSSGVTCENESTGHGFFMSRESIRFF